MKNIKITVKSTGIEKLIMSISFENPDGTINSKDINMSGNATVAVLHGAKLAIDALNEMNE